IIEMSIVLGSFCWFGFWFLLFTRLLPPVAIAELKEVLPTPTRPMAAVGTGGHGGDQ
ncbi:MAG TPA: hydrogenase, partial [Gemmatimonadetes bacterium]|nr:hydrogenase [Gemmatimonadota bacterium]